MSHPTETVQVLRAKLARKAVLAAARDLSSAIKAGNDAPELDYVRAYGSVDLAWDIVRKLAFPNENGGGK